VTDEVLFNPFAPDFYDDPYPFYRRLQEREPIHQMPMGAWVLTR
jgi:pimeloyl-[acyl-carrier protein] synthase